MAKSMLQEMEDMAHTVIDEQATAEMAVRKDPNDGEARSVLNAYDNSGSLADLVLNFVRIWKTRRGD